MADKVLLTVTTGEPYQPIRLTFKVKNQIKLQILLKQSNFLQFDSELNAWRWLRVNQYQSIHFMCESFIEPVSSAPITMAMMAYTDDYLCIDFQSFERAYTLLPLLDEWLDRSIAHLQYADFINHFHSTKQPLLEVFADLFDETVLQADLLNKQQRLQLANMGNQRPTNSKKALSDLITQENRQPLPPAERYLIELALQKNLQDKAIMLAFTAALVLRHQVAMRHWLGDISYALDHAFSDLPLLTTPEVCA